MCKITDIFLETICAKIRYWQYCSWVWKAVLGWEGAAYRELLDEELQAARCTSLTSLGWRTTHSMKSDDFWNNSWPNFSNKTIWAGLVALWNAKAAALPCFSYFQHSSYHQMKLGWNFKTATVKSIFSKHNMKTIIKHDMFIEMNSAYLSVLPAH